MPEEAENTKTESKTGKDILLSLLKNSFAPSLSLLEKRTEEQMTSLTFTSKTFSDFTSQLDNLSKQVEETKQKKEKEEKEKEAKRDKEKEKSGGVMKRSKTVGKLSSTQKNNTSVLGGKNNIKTSTTGKTSTSKPKNKTVSNFKAEEDGKKKTLEKSKTLKTLKSKKNDLSVDKSLNQSSSSIRKKSGTSVGKKKVVKESIKNISIKKEVEKSEKEDAKKEEKKEEPKKEEPPKEKPIERKPIEFYINTYSKEKWFDNIIAYMNSSDALSFVSSTKLFKEKYQKIVKDYEASLKEILDLHEGQTVDNKIEEFNIKYKSDEDPSKPYPEFQLTKGALRAIELLNNDKYNQLFKKNILDPNLKAIVVIYRILFLLLNEKTICSIEDDSEFWIKVCDFFNEKGIDKIGTFLVDSTKSFNFEDHNVYLINKLIINRKAKMLPSYYSKICSTTGLIMFLIKDVLEYCGIIFSEKKTPHNRVVNTLLYEKKLLEKISHLKEIVDKI